MRPTVPRLAASLVAVGVLASCSSGGGSAAGETTPGAVVTEPAVDAPDFVRNSGEVIAGGADAAPPDEPGGTEPATTIAIVPDTGVPGIDSDDAFCRSWSEFAGSFQALGLVSALGDPAAAPRLEVIASPAVLAAAAGLDAHLPAALEGERDALTQEFAGPFARRAERAHDALRAAGIDRDDELRDVWLEQLAATGVDDPSLDVVLPPDIDVAAIDTAAAAFAAALPRIVEDPSLVTSVEIPLTEAHLAANCPDQGILGGNDVVSS